MGGEEDLDLGTATAEEDGEEDEESDEYYATDCGCCGDDHVVGFAARLGRDCGVVLREDSLDLLADFVAPFALVEGECFALVVGY